MNSPPPKPEVILTNFFAEPTVLLVPITSRVELVTAYVYFIEYTLYIISAIELITQLVRHAKDDLTLTSRNCFTWCVAKVKFDPTGELCTQVCHKYVYLQ